MDLRVTNITNTKFHKLQCIEPKQDIKTEGQQNLKFATLPDYRSYIAISFGANKPRLNSEDFLLPPGTIPDKYQIDAALSLQKCNNTIVTAPTGTGKTAIAHFIIKKNFEEDKRTFYTTPLKALSNQKYHDLKKLFGEQNVGILTGDRKENVKAPIVIMTTEIYRNMVTSHYFNSRNEILKDLKTVIFDEFHYMGDPDRGSVWEESIMYTPPDTQILALSATVGNNKKIASWIGSIKKRPTSLIDVPNSNRHVPLQFIMHNPESKEIRPVAHQNNINVKAIVKRFYDGKFTHTDHKVLDELAEKIKIKPSNKGRRQVIELLRIQFKNKTVPVEELQTFLYERYDIPPEETLPLILKLTDKKDNPRKKTKGQVIGTTTRSKNNPINVIKVISKLKEENKLPAIAFVFSKKYSEALLKTAEKLGKDLTNRKEKEEILRHIREYENEYGLYSTNLNKEALLKGYAIHSAAILPLQKQLIEELFNKKLIKVAFATETLAAGINMPARTVIMTDYQKPSGTSIKTDSKNNFLRPLSANEFHQMCGRAGRRGIDKVGYAVLITDSPEKQAQFEKLIASEPDSVTSSLILDASNVSSFFEHLNDPNDMKLLLNLSFSVHNTPKQDRELRVNNHMIQFQDYLKLLQKYGFVVKTESGYTTTEKGTLVSLIKGKPQIPIIKAILDRRFDSASAPDLAGLIGAIAANSAQETNLILSNQNQTPDNPQKLIDINNAIDYTLNNDFNFSSKTLSSTNTNEEILNALEEKYGEIIQKDPTEIAEQREKLLKLIFKEEKELKRNNGVLSQDNALAKLKKHAKRLKNEQSLIRRTRYIKGLLEQRLGLALQEKYGNEKNTKNEIFNALVQDFDKYNKDTICTNTKIPNINLNLIALHLVGKWAEINSESQDYKANWQYICTLLNENGSIKYEGDLFNAIAQTIDFIHQIETVLIAAQNLKDVTQEDKAYYQAVREKCKEAVKLLKKPPLYNASEI